MSIKSTHPLYQKNLDANILMRNSYEGEDAMKEAGIKYLPPTKGMLIDGMASSTDIGAQAYAAYRERAVYPSFVSEAVEALIGLLHQNPPSIKLPTQMEPLLDKATVDGEGLYSLMRRINEQQLVTGRVGLLLDLPEVPDPANPLPFFAMYNAEAVRNWDDGEDNIDLSKLSMVVLDESGFKRDGFDWVNKESYRVLTLGNPEDETQPDVYHCATGAPDAVTGYTTPQLRGKTLKQIPFAFVNCKDNLSKPDRSPLLALANLCKAIYRAEADYRQALYLQGQDTLVVVGGMKTQWNESTQTDEEVRIGAGARIDLDLGGSAQFIGTSSQGLPEMRNSLENDRRAAKAMAGKLIDEMGSKQESGEALKTRLSAQTATLNQIAEAGARAVQNLLRICAEWLGANPDEVEVIPNKEFTDLVVTGKDLLDLVQAKNQGAPLSKESLHAFMVERGLTKKTYEEEMDLIGDEDPLMGTPAGALALLPPPAVPGKEDEEPTDNNAPPAKDEK